MTDTPERVDGRVERGRRTRAAIVTAFLDLITEGDPRPSARAIAARAGVSVRSIFQHFADLESLREDVVRIQTERVRPLFLDLDRHGDLDQRIAALADQRCALYEFIAPLRRSMTYVERGPAIELRMAEMADALRHQVAMQFPTELEALAPERRGAALAALDALTSYEAWDQLRHSQGLSPDDARHTVADAVAALVRP
jgi:TetR/AcrR family transcriptional regulator, regulator of autoinduction and epiphytic fitness